MVHLQKLFELADMEQEDIEFTLEYKFADGRPIKKLEKVKSKDVFQHVIYPEYNVCENQLAARLKDMNKQELNATKRYILNELRAYKRLTEVFCLYLTRTT